MPEVNHILMMNRKNVRFLATNMAARRVTLKPPAMAGWLAACHAIRASVVPGHLLAEFDTVSGYSTAMKALEGSGKVTVHIRGGDMLKKAVASLIDNPETMASIREAIRKAAEKQFAKKE